MTTEVERFTLKCKHLLLIGTPAPLQTLHPDVFARDCVALVPYLTYRATPPCKAGKSEQTQPQYELAEILLGYYH